MIKEAKAKPLTAVIGISLHGQVLQRLVAKVFNPGIFSKEELVTLDIEEAKRQILDELEEILSCSETLKSELAKV